MLCRLKKEVPPVWKADKGKCIGRRQRIRTLCPGDCGNRCGDTVIPDFIVFVLAALSDCGAGSHRSGMFHITGRGENIQWKRLAAHRDWWNCRFSMGYVSGVAYGIACFIRFYFFSGFRYYKDLSRRLCPEKVSGRIWGCFWWCGSRHVRQSCPPASD